MLDLLFGSDNKDYFLKPSGATHEFYLTGTIGRPEEYTSWFNTMRHAGPDDYIVLYINSHGGDMFTAIQLLNCMADTQATVVGRIEGACMSAATMIFLSCDRFMLGPNSMFMIHNYSGGTIGKGGEMYDNITFERRWSKKLFKEIYEDFLTQKEIANVLDGKDLWLTTEEVHDRLVKRKEKHEKIVAKEAADVIAELMGAEDDID